MKIGIDARLWSESGVGRYIRSLVANLGKIDKSNSYVLFILEKDREGVEKKIPKEWKSVTFNSKWHSLSEQINFPKIIQQEKVDLMHFPYHSMPIFYRSPYILTIHDLIPYHFITGKSSTLPLWLYGFKVLAYRFVINSAAKNAKKIIAVSNFTKDDVMNHLQVKKNDVEVVYEAADDLVPGQIQKSEEKYFLYVGNVYPHKNAEKLIKAFENFIKSNPNYCLVFAGKRDYFYERLEKSNKKLINSKNIRFVYDSDDEDLSSLYRNAVSLIRPSLMEGFSLSPLEAMQSGCLVLGSDIPVHREIFKDSMVYFDPVNVADINSKLELVNKMDDKKKKEAIDKGLQLAKNFTWDKTARQTLAVYESCFSL